MPRSITLFTGPWADLPLEALAAKAADWGYNGFELCCWGDHLEIQRGLSDDAYAPARLELLARYDLQVPVIANHKVGQAISDVVDSRHKALLPEYVWGDGKPAGVQQRAIEELTATFRLAEKLGAGVVSGFTGSPVWGYTSGYPAPKPGLISDALKKFAVQWGPILDAAAECGVRFACEVHPGQLAFDLYSTEVVLEALGNREEFGLTFDPSHLHWQGVDPVAFLRRFADRIYHVHIKDATLTLDGKAGVLAGYWPSDDPRRGWQFRSPGRGGIDWESIIRALNEIRYDGPLSVDWHDAGMDREFGAAEARGFVKNLDFDPPQTGPKAFRGVMGVKFPEKKAVDELRKVWSDRLVRVKPGSRPELSRFEGKVGRVVTVNYSGRAIVDFADGAWYDVPGFDAVLEEVTDEAAKKKYDATVNSAQKLPGRQG